jgi:hypothetical protein
VPKFAERVLRVSADADRPERIESLMLNVGLRCDAACAHCHHACTAERTELMSRDTMLGAITLAEMLRPDLVDITGGEPEEYAALPELVTRMREAGLAVRVRTNLVALARPEHAELPELFADLGVQVLASLPGTSAAAIEAQRGSAWWESALAVLQRLTRLGYGAGDAGERGGAGSDDGGGADSDGGLGGESSARRLILDLAYNPESGEIARPQAELAREFREVLTPLGVRFDSLLAIGNVPVGRMRTQLRVDDRYAEYVAHLADEFNPDVVDALGCRHGIEVAWDGTLWDCDFNLAARTRPAAGPLTLAELLGAADLDALLTTRRIGFGPHCYACTAAAGSS